MVLANKLGLTSQAELDWAEEKLSKQKAKKLFDSGRMKTLPVGTFAGLAAIHQFLFEDVYDFTGKTRDVNLIKGNFRFAPVLYLAQALQAIDAMPQANFDKIIDKYVEMNIAHPFREGNGRSTRIWLDLILKNEIGQVVDWNLVDKEVYLSAIERSPVNSLELNFLLKQALTKNSEDRALYMKGIDASYHYEGYTEYRTDDL